MYACGNFKKLKNAYGNENVIFYEKQSDKLNFEDYGIPVIDIYINGVKKHFILDTGAPTFLFFNKSDFLKSQKTEQNFFPFPTISSIKTPDGEKIEVNAFIVDSVRTNLFFGTKKVSMVLNKSLEIKCKKLNVSGIVGNDIFSYSHLPIYYDFSNSYIKTIDENFNKDGFFSIESKFKFFGNKIEIKLSIDNFEYWFTFDTGYAEFIHLSKHNLKNKPIDIETINLFVDLKPKRDTGSIYTDLDIKIADKLVFKGQVITFNDVESDLIGMKFIKNFDWIIDHPNKKIYAKPRHIFDTINNSFIDYSKYKYASKIIDSEITIVGKAVSETRYQLGDVIISINNKMVTNENICKMQELLSTSSNWEALNLIVKQQKD